MRRSAGFGLNLPGLSPIPSHFLEHVRMTAVMATGYMRFAIHLSSSFRPVANHYRAMATMALQNHESILLDHIDRAPLVTPATIRNQQFVFP
jgi:hypothetical protein